MPSQTPSCHSPLRANDSSHLRSKVVAASAGLHRFQSADTFDINLSLSRWISAALLSSILRSLACSSPTVLPSLVSFERYFWISTSSSFARSWLSLISARTFSSQLACSCRARCSSPHLASASRSASLRRARSTFSCARPCSSSRNRSILPTVPDGPLGSFCVAPRVAPRGAVLAVVGAPWTEAALAAEAELCTSWIAASWAWSSG
mmetsp:Transcript_115669/g.314108  ORF Transcript_115669/g.314108 Transcript_115669/m.314108 type:complete len:206 (-) Transcript_115669:546-1163(-)